MMDKDEALYMDIRESFELAMAGAGVAGHTVAEILDTVDSAVANNILDGTEDEKSLSPATLTLFIRDKVSSLENHVRCHTHEEALKYLIEHQNSVGLVSVEDTAVPKYVYCEFFVPETIGNVEEMLNHAYENYYVQCGLSDDGQVESYIPTAENTAWRLERDGLYITMYEELGFDPTDPENEGYWFSPSLNADGSEPLFWGTCVTRPSMTTGGEETK